MFVSYDTIVFEILKTNDFSIDAVYTEDNTDYLYSHCRIDCEMQLNPQATAYILEGGFPTLIPGTLPGTTHAAIRHFLMQPRKSLMITDSLGQTVLQSPADGESSDVKNGPLPRSCAVRNVIGAKTWVFRWVCETWILECPFSTPAMISNRWQDEHHINQYQLTTRIASGKMIFRRDILDDVGKVAHAFFDAGDVPPVAPGFQRESLDLVAQSDGLALAWRIRDVEKVYDLGETDPRMGGSGIIKIDGAYGLSSISMGEGPPGAMSIAQVDLRAYGTKAANQWVMIQRLIQLALTKITVGSNLIGFLRHVAIRESMGADEKWVELTLAFQQTAAPTTLKAGGIRTEGLRKDVTDIFQNQGGANPGLLNETRGTALVTALTQALQDACEEVQQYPPAGGYPTTGPPSPSGPPPTISVTPSELLPDYPSRYSTDPEQEQYPYTKYKGSIEYEIHSGTLLAPTTGPPPGGSSFGGGSGGTGSMAASGPNSESWSWPAAIFQVASPTGRMRISFQSERLNKPPLVPTLTPSDGNLVLHQYRLRPDMPIVWNDGISLIYSVNGWYEFLMERVPQIDDSYRMGILPWINISFLESLLSPDDFVTGIFDDPSGSGSSGGSGTFGTST